jgi:hypothetical protein
LASPHSDYSSVGFSWGSLPCSGGHPPLLVSFADWSGRHSDSCILVGGVSWGHLFSLLSMGYWGPGSSSSSAFHQRRSNSSDCEASAWGTSLVDDLSTFVSGSPLVSKIPGHPCPPSSTSQAPGIPPLPSPATAKPTNLGGPSLLPSLVPPVRTPIPLPIDWFTLPPIKSGNDYLKSRDLILFWLWCPGFLTARDNSLLVMDECNALASQFWEGQLRTSLKDGTVCFLFDNTGSTLYGKGFEMLQVLEENFCPLSISNSFTTLAFSTTPRAIRRGFVSFACILKVIWVCSLNLRWLSLPSCRSAFSLGSTFTLPGCFDPVCLRKEGSFSCHN